jgi:hypothetical protein
MTPETIKKAKRLLDKQPDIGRKRLAEKLEVTDREARFLSLMLHNPELLTEDTDLAIRYRKLQVQNQDLRKQNRNLIDKYNEKEKQNDVLLAIETEDLDEQPIKEITKDTKGNATATALLSDIHCEEKVDPDVVLGLNEYTPEICSQRLEGYFQKLLKYINHHRKNYKIDTLILGLLGDMITGYIHEDLRETNFMSPTEATMFVKEKLINGIRFLAENGNFKKIVIPCAKGNHGRNTYTKRFATAYKNSYEWMMYHDMKKTFSNFGYDSVEFIIPKSEFTYVQSFDKTLLFSHGDHFGYQGGIGGFQVPLMKWAMRQKMLKHYDVGFLGHWHQILHPAEHIYTNGSIIGHTSYAVGKSIAPTEPAQLLSIQHQKYGFVESHKIVL